MRETEIHVTKVTYRLMQSNILHDDVIKWKHFPRYWPFVRGIHRSPVNSPHRVRWRGALMFSSTWAWINGGVNNRDAGDLRRHVIMTSLWCAALQLLTRCLPPPTSIHVIRWSSKHAVTYRYTFNWSMFVHIFIEQRIWSSVMKYKWLVSMGIDLC